MEITKMPLWRSSLGMLLFWCSLSYAQPNKIFEEGNNLYNEGKYEEALGKYEKIELEGFESAELYFNMANAHYKLNHVAPSIFYYEKALLLEPGDDDIKNNLSFAQNMTLDSIDVLPPTGFARIFNGVLERLSYEGWAWLAVVASFLFVFCFIAYYVSSFSMRKRIYFLVSLLSLGMMLLSIAAAFREHDRDQKNRPAIIFKVESQVKAEPNQASELAFVLHEGAKVQVLEELGEWKKIRLADGKMGWIKKEDLREVRELP